MSSRNVNEDFNTFIKFLKDYTLKDTTQEPRFMESCKSLHRKLYSLMIFKEEITLQNRQSACMSEIGFKYLNETISDIMLSLFCWSNGAYKPASLQVRSSIENFLKAAVGQSNPHIINEKRVFEIFEQAKKDIFFNNVVGEKYFDVFKNYYSNLCAIAHSDIDSLSEVGSLKYLPAYNNDTSIIFVRNYLAIIENINASCFLNFYENIYRMHPANQSEFLSSINKMEKTKIINYCLEKKMRITGAG